LKFYDKGKIKFDADVPILQSIYSSINTLCSAMPSSSNCKQNVVILLSYAEKILPHILSDLFKSITLTNNIIKMNHDNNDSFKNYGNIHMTIVLVYSSCRPLPLHVNGFTSTNLSISIHSTCSPVELYDNVLTKIISQKGLNIIVEKFSDIHFDFFRNHQCVWVVIDR